MRPDQIAGLTGMSAAVPDGSRISEATGVGEPGGAEEFTSLIAARAYVRSIRASICSLAEAELAAALPRLGMAYQQFPELALECPVDGFLEQLQSTAATPKLKAVALAVALLSASGPMQSVIPQLRTLIEETDGWETLLLGLRLVLDCREIAWPPIEMLFEHLQHEGRADKLLQLLSAVLGHIQFPDERSRLAFDDVLRSLLEVPQLPHNERGFLVKLAASARRRLKPPVFDQSAKPLSTALVDTAERLRIILSPTPLDKGPVVAWPSGRLSFDEFLLQWPCTVELPFDLEDSEFIKEAYRAILLRDAGPDEMEQHLTLMREAMSRIWIVEDLLACEELRSLGRQLAVNLGNCVITEPGRHVDENNPTVTWPMRATP